MPPEPLEAPAYVLWEIGLRCNLRCEHCAGRAGNARRDELTTDEALGVCEQLAELGTPSVCLMGGEPLVRRDWRTIAATLRRSGIHVGIITNGWAFDDAIAAEVLELGMCQVGVSLDAAEPSVHDRIRGRQGAHGRALEAIARVHSLPIPYKTVITSVHRENLGELQGIAELLCQNAPGVTWMVNIASSHDEERFGAHKTLDEDGVMDLARFIDGARREYGDTLSVGATHDLGYFSNRFDLHDFEWHGCVAGLETLGIRSNGDVVGCLVMDDTLVEGSVRHSRLVDLWRRPDAFAYNRCFRVEQLEGACAGCEHGEACRGGCTDHALSFTNRLFEYPFCLHRLETRGRLR